MGYGPVSHFANKDYDHKVNLQINMTCGVTVRICTASCDVSNPISIQTQFMYRLHAHTVLHGQHFHTPARTPTAFAVFYISHRSLLHDLDAPSEFLNRL